MCDYYASGPVLRHTHRSTVLAVPCEPGQHAAERRAWGTSCRCPGSCQAEHSASPEHSCGRHLLRGVAPAVAMPSKRSVPAVPSKHPTAVTSKRSGPDNACRLGHQSISQSASQSVSPGIRPFQAQVKKASELETRLHDKTRECFRVTSESVTSESVSESEFFRVPSASAAAPIPLDSERQTNH